MRSYITKRMVAAKIEESLAKPRFSLASSRDRRQLSQLKSIHRNAPLSKGVPIAEADRVLGLGLYLRAVTARPEALADIPATAPAVSPVPFVWPPYLPIGVDRVRQAAFWILRTAATARFRTRDPLPENWAVQS